MFGCLTCCWLGFHPAPSSVCVCVCVCVCLFVCVPGVVKVGVRWPLSDGLFSPKWRHKGGGGSDGEKVYVCVCVCVCAPCRKEGKEFRVPRDELLLCHVIMYSSFTSLHSPPSPIPRPLSFLRASHSAAAPSWAAGGGNLWSVPPLWLYTQRAEGWRAAAQ